MTLEELVKCVPATMLDVGRDKPVIFNRVVLDNMALCVDGSLWTPAGVSVIEIRSRSLVVTGLTPELSANLQTAAFAIGMRWSSGHTVVVNADKTGLVFKFPSNWIAYNPILNDPQSYYLNAADPWDFAAARWYLSATAPTVDSVIGKDVMEIIRVAPTNPMLRGLVRAKTGKAIPISVIEQGTDAVLGWLKEFIDAKNNFIPPVQEDLDADPYGLNPNEDDTYDDPYEPDDE